MPRPRQLVSRLLIELIHYLTLCKPYYVQNPYVSTLLSLTSKLSQGNTSKVLFLIHKTRSNSEQHRTKCTSHIRNNIQRKQCQPKRHRSFTLRLFNLLLPSYPTCPLFLYTFHSAHRNLCTTTQARATIGKTSSSAETLYKSVRISSMTQKLVIFPTSFTTPSFPELTP